VTKIETKINFPINDFNINKYVLNNENNNVYNLYGVIYHSGTKDNGHYYVNAYNLYKKKWYNFDDKKVKEILDLNNEIITKNAYVLFYIKKEWENMSEENQIKLFKKKLVNYDEKISELIGFYKNNNDNLNFLYI
jgi:ubiquitin carboxyl-terminal hydrolase 4/11/15